MLPVLWVLAGLISRRTPKSEPPVMCHSSIGAEVFTPREPPPSRGRSTSFIRVGTQPWRRWREPIVVERAVVPTPVHIVAISWQGVSRASCIVWSLQTSVSCDQKKVRLSPLYEQVRTGAALRWGIFLTQIATSNRTIASLITSRSSRLHATTPRVKLTPRELPSPSGRFRRRVILSSPPLTKGDRHV